MMTIQRWEAEVRLVLPLDEIASVVCRFGKSGRK
jgi:hypothetical protein